MSKLEAELVCLFGRQTLENAKQLSPTEVSLEAALVAKVAQKLLKATGQPIKQQAIIQELTNKSKLALCRWLHETCMLGQILR